MRYFVTVAGRTFEVVIDGDAVSVDGVPLPVDLATLPGTHVRHLVAGQRAFELAARRLDKGRWALDLGGRTLEADVVDERMRAIRAFAAAAPPAGPKPVRAPMPGLIVRVEVEPGQRIEAGQGVVIIEAMKMENELRAEAPGVVSRVLVRAGQAVEKGAVLVEFDAA
jgi:biotin carboxyl carrier protein